MSVGAVVVFGREPEPGRVKTRLAADIGEGPASMVYDTLLEHTLHMTAISGLRAVLSLAEPPSDGWTPPTGVRVEQQSDGDLGQRMSEAFARRFAEGEERVVVIGSDGPWVMAEHLLEAVSALDRAGVVLGPADDGGYWLVGQRSPGVDLFSGIPWSSPGTLERTLERLEALGVSSIEIEKLLDIDTAADLDRVLADPRTPDSLRNRLLRALTL